MSISFRSNMRCLTGHNVYSGVGRAPKKHQHLNAAGGYSNCYLPVFVNGVQNVIVRERNVDPAIRRGWESLGHVLHYGSGWECWAHDSCAAVQDGGLVAPGQER